MARWTDVQLEQLGGAILTAIEGAGLGLSVVFIDEAVPQIAWINEAGARILGHPRESILSRPAFDFFTQQQDTDAAKARLEARRAGRDVPKWFELTTARADGTPVPLQVSVTMVQLDGRPASVNFFIDVSSQKQALDALRRSETLFRTLVEHAPEAIAIFDGRRFLYTNPAAATMLGYQSEADLLALDPLNVVHPAERERMIARSRRVIQEGVVLPPVEYRGLRRDGAEVVVETSSIRVEWQGHPALLAFSRDVTPRKRLEAQLMRTDRLAALGTLVAGIAHEINNPLTWVLLAIEQVQSTLAGDPITGPALAEARARLADVRLGIDRIADIVRQLRASVRGDRDVREAVDLRAVMLSAARIAHNELRHRTRLVTELAETPAVKGSIQRLEQVFLNLILNAVHALPEDRAETNEVRLSLRKSDDGGVIAEVSDTGAGIPADVLPRIFDPFFTTKDPGVGLGLGLSICHSIVVSHDGTIEAESAEGGGATFRVRFPPSCLSDTPARTSAPPPSELNNERRARVLIVDDEPGLNLIIGRMLGRRHDCTSVTDGPSALAHLAAHPVDVVLCDLMMPGMTGIDLYENSRKTWPQLERRFVFMTGGAFTARAAEFAAQVQCPIVEKPFTLQRLLDAITEVLREGE